jgi:hypothetical protein
MAGPYDLVSGLFSQAQSIANTQRSNAESKINAAIGSLGSVVPAVVQSDDPVPLVEELVTTPFMSAAAITAASEAYTQLMQERRDTEVDFAMPSPYSLGSDNPQSNYDTNLGEIVAAVAANLTNFYSTHFPITLAGTELTLGQDWIINVLTTGGAMNPAIEEQYWQRDRDRLTREGSTKIDEVVTNWAARGFPLPPGAATGAVLAIQRTQLEQSAQSSREVAIKKFEIEVMLQQKAVELAIQLRSTAVASLFEYIKTTVLAPYEYPQKYASMIAQSKQAANASLDLYYNSTNRAKENLRETMIKVAEAGTDRHLGSAMATLTQAMSNFQITASTILAQTHTLFEEMSASKTFELTNKSKQADLAMSGAQLSATMAAAALNGVHGNATVSGISSDNTQYYG